ncbi:hypothetical protein ECMP02101711_2756 [Escherichia coli MP021017.11]|nr:hypothetical protein ECMP02101711_2756 [Escherichia coli MP021017.11]
MIADAQMSAELMGNYCRFCQFSPSILAKNGKNKGIFHHLLGVLWKAN